MTIYGMERIYIELIKFVFHHRHVQLSDLHKTNMENMRKARGSGEGSGAGGLTSAQYRDRAKERRQKYGEPSVPAPNKLKVSYLDFLFLLPFFCLVEYKL